jgi:hypothetical protein
MYFGKYAEMYFDEKRKDEESGIVRRSRKTDSYFALLKEKFNIEDVQKVANVTRKTAFNIVCRWMAERRVSPKSKYRGYYVKAG